MKEIRINRMTLENFKCHKSLTLDFVGENVSVLGDNATGKTCIYDALTWLLFGKDSRGNGEKNMEIKPLNGDGEVEDHEALTAVEAVLTIDGLPRTFRRTYREVWSTKRGSTHATYDGNTSEYYVDGVPMKKGLFQEQVGYLADEDTFRMLTSVSHFAADIPWQERREVLFRLAGVEDDRDILAGNARFAPLLEGMGHFTLEDYKRRLLAEKKGFVGAKTELPARISECQKTIDDLRGLDFGFARAEAERIRTELETVQADILALDNDSARKEKEMAIRELRLAMNQLEMENLQHLAVQRAKAPDISWLEERTAQMKKRTLLLEKQRKEYEDSAEALEAKIQAARDRWIALNAQQVQVDGLCPACRQPLPQDRMQKALDGARLEKQRQLDRIQEEANDLKRRKGEAEDMARNCRERLADLWTGLEKRESELLSAKEQRVVAEDLPGYPERMADYRIFLRSANEELERIAERSSLVRQSLQQKQRDLKEALRGRESTLAKENILDYSRRRIEELKEDARNGAAVLEAIEETLLLMEEYARYKTQYIQESVNSLFQLASFRLYREQANGGVEDRCDVTYDGIPYAGVNNGMKINLGLDIINTISRAYGVRVPLFIDNAECVTWLHPIDSQVIRLVVSEEDKELRIEHEN